MKIYELQKKISFDPEPYFYFVSDIVYRNPLAMAEPEPPVEYTCPIVKPNGETDDLAIYLGVTKHGRPFCWNPRHVVNPMVLIVGIPGAGKSVPPGERVIVKRGGEVVSERIENVKRGDLVLGASGGASRWTRVLDTLTHEYSGKLVRLTLASGRRVTVTSDHSIITIDKRGELASVRAGEISVGEPVVAVVPPETLELELPRALASGLSLVPRARCSRGRCVLAKSFDNPARRRMLVELARIAGAEASEEGDTVRITVAADPAPPHVVAVSSMRSRRVAALAILLAATGDKRLRVRDAGAAATILSSACVYAEERGRNTLVVKRVSGRMRSVLELAGVEVRGAEIPYDYSRAQLAARRIADGCGAGSVFVDAVARIERISYAGTVYDLSTETENFASENLALLHNSATVKTLIHNFRLINKNVPVIIVDPEGEYPPVGKVLGEEKHMIVFRLGEDANINPFDRPSKSIPPTIWYFNVLTVFMKFMNIGEQSPLMASLLLEAMHKAMEARGIREDRPETWMRPSASDITLKDIYAQVKEIAVKLEHESGEGVREKRASIARLEQRLKKWTSPPYSTFADVSSIDLKSIFNYRLVIFDASKFSTNRELYGFFSYWLVSWFYGLMVEWGPLPQFGLRVLLIIDEAWSLLEKKREGEMTENPLNGLARRARKYGIGLIITTQTPEDVDKKMFSLFGTIASGMLMSENMAKLLVESRGMSERFTTLLKQLQQGQLLFSMAWRRKDFPMSMEPLVVSVEYPIPELVNIV